ncbi:hypothetical protein EK21DRAFT_84129 [Setomelanomma holmii]|uniref:DUF1996 domain-containing protein n=1 Tax=Setomelanomma holmii TaxID=210430 RepID=A0A9P4HLG0_9PLEO|nr:hypothetical protein EK21DRAFT_84129 [Setomelanomma holmii]
MRRSLQFATTNMHTSLFNILLFVSYGTTQMVIPTMLRFECSQLVVDRLDPLVSPGSIPSPHLQVSVYEVNVRHTLTSSHQIVGGNSFNASMNPATHDLPVASTCTSCTFSEDFSKYWTAVLYFGARNGTFKRVPRFVSEGLHGNGGIIVYYIPDATNSSSVTAFEPGFRLLVADATAISPSVPRKLCQRCMPVTRDNSWLNCAASDYQSLPKGFCPGARDHQSHVAYANGSNATDVCPTGKCPASHLVVIPQVMYEVVWDTRIFNDVNFQPFVYSTGEHTESTFSGGKTIRYNVLWTRAALADTCSVLKSQTTEEAMKCTIPR